jgi:hypothetical protein
MGLYHGLARLLEVGGALSRGPYGSDRLQLPRDGTRRTRWSRDEFGLFQWSAQPKRGSQEVGASHDHKRAPSRSAA